MQIPVLAELVAKGKTPEILFWVGCAGSFDNRAQKVTRAFCKILHEAGISYAILGNEEQCTGDAARRAGNEFVFQMAALQNIQVLDGYGVTKIVTACPHCFNTLKNDYPALGGHYEVLHHTQLIHQLFLQGRLKLKEGGSFKGKRITYHDSCYLGRINGVYEIPRTILAALDADLVELKRSKSNGLCCGAGGAQMFKEDEPGDMHINVARTEEVLTTNPAAVVANCPFCITMLQDGLKAKEKQDEVAVRDIAELVAERL